MRVVFAGTPDVAVPSLDAIVAAGHDVVAVLTRPDAPSGRGKKVAASPVAQRADSLGVRVVKPATLRGDEVLATFRELAPDVCPVVAYGNLVPDALLAVPPHGWVNLHFSRLPAWRGAAPVQRAILAGDITTAVTTFELVTELDAGPIYRVLDVPIADDIHAGELLADLARRGAAVLVDTLADIEAGVRPIPQPDADVTYAAKITPADARIDWTSPARQVHNLVRATDPAPGAWTTLDGERFKVLDTAPANPGLELEPGELAADKHHLWVGTGDGLLELRRVQPTGKKPMAGADWARGVHMGQAPRFA